MFDNIVAIYNNKIEELYKQVEQAKIDYANNLNAKRKEAYEQCYKDAIDEFYSWPASVYLRNQSLYNLFTVAIEGKHLRLTASGSNMTRTHNDKSLFNQVFKEGWHGGAMNKMTGTMMYRKPICKWSTWGSPAQQTTPPYELVQDNITEWDNTVLDELAQQTLEDACKNIRF